MHDESNVGRWLLLLRDGSEAEQQLARTELGLILEARGLHDEAAEAYARNVEDGATDRRPFERLAALARLRGDAEAEAQALRALAELLSPTPPSPQPDTQNPDPREDLTPPAPLRGANIGFADIISGAERGEAQEFDVGPEEQAQGADVDEVVGDEVSNEGFVLADDDAWEEASVIAADNDESSRANGDTPAAAVADHDAESAVEDAAEWSVAADDGEALAGAGDDERAGDTGNLPADDKQSTVDELDQADEPSPQEQRLTVISQHPFTHPDAASSQGHQDGTDSLEDEVDSPSPVHRSRGSTDLEGEGIPTPPGDPDESPAADALVVDDALPVDVPASGQPDQDPQTVASTADAATAAPEPASAPTRSSPPRGASTADAISRLRMWEVAGSRSFGGAGDESQVANAVPERPRSQPAMFRLLATLIGLAVVVLVVVGALMVPVSRPLSVTPAKPAASPAAAEQLLPAVVPTAIPPPPPPSPSPTAPVVQAPAPSPSPPAVSLAARCTDAALRFPESRDAVGEVRAAFRGYMARQGVTIDPASTLFAGLAQAHADRHAEVMAGWMAVTLQRERRGLPTFPLVDYVASDIIVAAGPGEYQLRATISPQGWNELRALPPDSCEGAFLTSPENARWVELMQASVGDITWALPTPQPRR